MTLAGDPAGDWARFSPHVAREMMSPVPPEEALQSTGEGVGSEPSRLLCEPAKGTGQRGQQEAAAVHADGGADGGEGQSTACAAVGLNLADGDSDRRPG
jgi:hypothetical protein